VEGTPFLFVSAFYLPTYLQSYVGHTYVLNSDEGLTDRAQDIGPRLWGAIFIGYYGKGGVVNNGEQEKIKGSRNK
jgi:hypothetical protein